MCSIRVRLYRPISARRLEQVDGKNDLTMIPLDKVDEPESLVKYYEGSPGKRIADGKTSSGNARAAFISARNRARMRNVVSWISSLCSTRQILQSLFRFNVTSEPCGP
jgi:hypothetical protein